MKLLTCPKWSLMYCSAMSPHDEPAISPPSIGRTCDDQRVAPNSCLKMFDTSAIRLPASWAVCPHGSVLVIAGSACARARFTCASGWAQYAQTSFDHSTYTLRSLATLSAKSLAIL